MTQLCPGRFGSGRRRRVGAGDERRAEGGGGAPVGRVSRRRVGRRGVRPARSGGVGVRSPVAPRRVATLWRQPREWRRHAPPRRARAPPRGAPAARRGSPGGPPLRQPRREARGGSGACAPPPPSHTPRPRAAPRGAALGRRRRPGRRAPRARPVRDARHPRRSPPQCASLLAANEVPRDGPRASRCGAARRGKPHRAGCHDNLTRRGWKIFFDRQSTSVPRQNVLSALRALFVVIGFRRRRRWILELIVSTRKYLTPMPSVLRPPLRDAALARGLENWRLSFRRGGKSEGRASRGALLRGVEAGVRGSWVS